MFNTLEIFRSYCDQKFPEENRERMLKILYRSEITELEEKYGKGFFDWDSDQYWDFLSNLKVDSTKSKSFRQKASWSYINYLLSFYRDIIEYQMQETGNYHKNHLADKRFRSMDRVVGENDTVFTNEDFERLCVATNNVFPTGEAEFTELMIWLLYSGAYDFGEIVNLKPEDIDLQKKTAVIGNRTIHLKDRCVELLEINHEIPEYAVYRQINLMLPYHGSYVWFPCRMTKNVAKGIDPYDYTNAQHQERSEEQIRRQISKRFVKLREETNSYISYEMIYYLGIYNYLVERCGVDRLRVLLESSGNRGKQEESKELASYFQEYGAKIDYTTVDFYRLKHTLRQFL